MRRAKLNLSVKGQVLAASAVALLLLGIGNGIDNAYQAWVKEKEARTRSEAERVRSEDEHRLTEAQRKLDEDKEIQVLEEGRRRTKALLSYTNSLIGTTKSKIATTTRTSPFDALPVLGKADPHAEVSVGQVRLIKSPYPSLPQIKQALGAPAKCGQQDYSGEESRTWCEWSVNSAEDGDVSVVFYIIPKLGDGLQEIHLQHFGSERIGRTPSEWRFSK